jgi:hypothetical protein
VPPSQNSALPFLCRSYPMPADPHETADYLSHREMQERALAASATDPCARRVHLDLARRYADRRATLAAQLLHAA